VVQKKNQDQVEVDNQGAAENDYDWRRCEEASNTDQGGI